MSFMNRKLIRPLALWSITSTSLTLRAANRGRAAASVQTMDSRKARLATSNWLNEIERRAHRFSIAPCPSAPFLTPEEFNNGLWMDNHGFSHPLVVLDTLPSLNLPPGTPRPWTIDTFANIIGRNESLHVIDVATQALTKDKWTVDKWAKYFSSPPPRKRTLNVISLEFSHTPFARCVRAPEFVVREDWVHSLWPPEETQKWAAVNRSTPAPNPRGRPPVTPAAINARENALTTDKNTNERLSYPKASYYFLTGVAGCYTDFHVDFGGSSVWYAVLQGRKEFFAIPPTEENLAKFEKWTSSENQDQTFFGDLAGPVIKIVVDVGQTLLLPSGWIHSVYTPVDSLVIGGNYLHKYNVDMQMKICDIEERTKVPFNSRFPFWWLLQFYYLKEAVRNILHHRDLIVANGHLNLMPDWERRGLLALKDWVAQNLNLCPEGVLEYPIQFYQEVISFRLRGLYPMSFSEWREYIKTPKRLCVCMFPSETYYVYHERTNSVTEELNTAVMSTAEQEAHGAAISWIGCDWCGEWYHNNCVGMATEHNLPRWFCPNCTPFNPHDLTPGFLQPSPVYVPRPDLIPKPLPSAPRPAMAPTAPHPGVPQLKAKMQAPKPKVIIKADKRKKREPQGGEIEDEEYNDDFNEEVDEEGDHLSTSSSRLSNPKEESYNHYRANNTPSVPFHIVRDPEPPSYDNHSYLHSSSNQPSSNQSGDQKPKAFKFTLKRTRDDFTASGGTAASSNDHHEEERPTKMQRGDEADNGDGDHFDF